MNGLNLYLFDSKKKLRQPIVHGVSELIHAEDTYDLSAEIDAKYDAMPGEYLGFFCVDGRFRMFRIDTAEYDDAKDVTIITATDAAVSELANSVVPGAIRLTDGKLTAAVDAALKGSEFTVGEMTADGTKTGQMAEYYPKRWKALRAVAEEYDVRVVPYYEFENGEIVGKKVDILKKENVYRGRMIEGRTGSQDIAVIYSGVPIVRMYGVGATKSGDDGKVKDPPDCVTFTSAVWKKSNGDPADKPSGQAYIEDPDAIAEYGAGTEEVFEDKNENNAKKLLEKTWEELQKRKRPEVSGVATISDMEMIDGHEHKKICLYDKVMIRTRRGKDAEATIISIKRNYIRPSQTRITLGEETKSTSTRKRETITQKVASIRRAGGTASRYIETKQLIQLNANTIQMNAEEIVEINAAITTINGDLKVIGTLQAENAEFTKMLTGKSAIGNAVITNLSVSSFTMGRKEHVHKKVIDSSGNEFMALGYQL